MSLDTQGPGVVTLGDADRAAAVTAIRARLRVGLPDDDALIGAFAEAALGLAEQFVGQVLIARQMTVTLPVLSGWQRLGAVPVRVIDTIEAIDGAGVAIALPVTGYAIDIDARGDGWVRLADAGGAGRVRVTLTAGAADGWDALAPAIREGVTMLAAYLYDVRDATQPPPAAIAALWRPYRQIVLAPAGRA